MDFGAGHPLFLAGETDFRGTFGIRAGALFLWDCPTDAWAGGARASFAYWDSQNVSQFSSPKVSWVLGLIDWPIYLHINREQPGGARFFVGLAPGFSFGGMRFPATEGASRVWSLVLAAEAGYRPISSYGHASPLRFTVRAAPQVFFTDLGAHFVTDLSLNLGVFF
jgi:hypothetical protein